MTLSDVPNDPHWAIVKVYNLYEWDDRVGTSTYSGEVLQYVPYKKREDWEEEIKSLTASGTKFKAFSVGKAAKITTTITVQ